MYITLVIMKGSCVICMNGKCFLHKVFEGNISYFLIVKSPGCIQNGLVSLFGVYHLYD